MGDPDARRLVGTAWVVIVGVTFVVMGIVALA